MKPFLKVSFIISLAIAMLFIACKREYSCENCYTIIPPPTDPGTDTVLQPNRPPIANAGPDLAIILPRNTDSLIGRGSTDPDNNITGYDWKNISGPSPADIADPNAVQTQATNLTEGIYLFELTVTDAGGLSTKDTVQITVFGACAINNRPIVQATLIPVGTLSQARFGTLVATAANKIVFGGGFNDTGDPYTRVDIFDMTTNIWSTAELSESRTQMAVVTAGNKIFFAGGNKLSNTYSTRIDIYDALNNTWSTAELSRERATVAAASIGNKVFFAGGETFTTNGTAYYHTEVDVIDIYDLATNTWTIEHLSEKRGYLSATVAGNKIYLAGGFAGDFIDGFSVSDNIDIYDAGTNSWSVSHLLKGRLAHAAISTGNKIFWASGADSYELTGSFFETGDVEIKDIHTGVSTLNCMIPKTDFSAVIKDNNIIFFTGNTGSSDHFDIYNTTTGAWSTGLLNQTINAAGVISVNNTIYIAGGRQNNTQYYNQVWKLNF